MPTAYNPAYSRFCQRAIHTSKAEEDALTRRCSENANLLLDACKSGDWVTANEIACYCFGMVLYHRQIQTKDSTGKLPIHWLMIKPAPTFFEPPMAMAPDSEEARALFGSYKPEQRAHMATGDGTVAIAVTLQACSDNGGDQTLMIRDDLGNLPLHYCAMHGSEPLVSWTLETYSHVSDDALHTAKNAEGKTACKLAKERGEPKDRGHVQPSARRRARAEGGAQVGAGEEGERSERCERLSSVLLGKYNQAQKEEEVKSNAKF